MSTAKGGGTRTRGQKYQNKFAFQHNKNSKKTAMILSIEHEGLCNRCEEKIEWRKKFRKYKPIKSAKKCRGCEKKAITRAYHVLCKECAHDKKVCPMCATESKTSAIADADWGKRATSKEVDIYMSTLKEREKRSLNRKLERGDVMLRRLEDGSVIVYKMPQEEEEEEEEEDAEEGSEN